MSDDLSKLTPTTPAAVAPEWDDKRQGILDGILDADAPPHRGRWIAAAVAAAVAVLAVGGIVQQLRPVQEATPASPTPSAPSSASASPIPSPSPTPSTPSAPTPIGARSDLVAVNTLLVMEGDAATLCNSAITYTDPPSVKPQCEGIPVVGVSREDLPQRTVQHAGEFSWDNVIVTGTFDGTTMTAVDVYGMFDPKAPQDPSETGDAEDAYKDLCSDPIQGTGPGDRSMEEVARALPGYQMDWPGGPNFNVAVTGDLVAARRALAPYVERVFCVATVPGPSRADGEPVAKAVSAIAGVEDSYYAANAQGAWITVVTLTDDQSVKAEVEKVVGASMWPRILFSSFFYPVKD